MLRKNVVLIDLIVLLLLKKYTLVADSSHPVQVILFTLRHTTPTNRGETIGTI